MLDEMGLEGEMVAENRVVDIAKLSGKIDELKASIDGRFRIHELRLTDLESWKDHSEVFHVEMRKRWDNFDGNQEAEQKLQTERHRQNAAKINLLMLLVTVLVCLAAWATFFRPVSGHSFLDFHSQSEELGLYSSQPQLSDGR